MEVPDNCNDNIQFEYLYAYMRWLIWLPTLRILYRVVASNQQCLYLFVNLILLPVPPFPTHLFLHPSLLPLLVHHSPHSLLPFSFTSSLKPTCFTNPTPVVSHLPPGLPCPIRFFWATRFLFSFFPYFFVSVPCARLGWPSRQLLARTYGIV